MTYDQYPSAESKTPKTDALKEKLHRSILLGSLLQLSLTKLTLKDLTEYVHFNSSKEEIFGKVSEILKPSANSDVIRWLEQGNMAELTAEQEHIIFDLADELGLRLPVDHELPKVEEPLLVIESGANKTSVVRRELAEKMLDENGGTMYQFGSDERVIAPTRVDKNGNEVENPEYKVVSSEDVCGDLDERAVTEYEVNVLSALNNEYSVVDDSQEDQIVLSKGNIRLVIVKSSSFKDGLTKLANERILDGRNLVISTNGQYRPKDEIDAESVISASGVSVKSVTVIGDETGKRGAKIYLAEIAVLLKKLSK